MSSNRPMPLVSSRRPSGDGPGLPLRLNPFALPSDTTSRFLLLIVAVLSATLFAYSLLAFVLPSTQDRLSRARECLTATESIVLPDNTLGIDREKILARAQDGCWRPVLHWQAAIVVLGVVAVVLVAVLLYILVPSWKIRRRRLVPLEEEDAPELVARFRALCDQACLFHPPRLVWNPVGAASGALAFGRFRQTYVAVGPTLVVQYYTDPDAAEVVLRHEVAHLVNRDVNKTYLAVSLWYAFVVVGLLPLAVVHVVEGGVFSVSTLWRTAATVVLVYATRNAVLRAREYYADAWAGLVPEARAKLAEILGRVPRRRSKDVMRLLGVHPDSATRLGMLRDTAQLFRPRVLDALAAGILAGFAYPTLQRVLFLVVPLDYTLYIGAAAAVVSASLIGVALGAGVWRAGLAARARDASLPRVAPLGLAAALGFSLGSQISPGGPGTTLGGTLLLTAMLVVALAWLVGTADAWFDAVPSTRSGRLFATVALSAAGLVVWSTGWVNVVAVGQRTSASAAFLAGLVAAHRWTPVVIACLILFPVAASLLRRRVRSSLTPAWVLAEDAPVHDRLWPQRIPLAVARSLSWGGLAGASFCVLIVVLRVLDVAPRELIEPIDEIAFQYAPGLDHAPVALAIGLQALIAGIVALRARRLPILHALLTVPAASALMTVGVALPYLLEGDGFPDHLSTQARRVLAGGAVAALVLGGVIDTCRRSVAGRVATVSLCAAIFAASLLWEGGSRGGDAPLVEDVALTPEQAHAEVTRQIQGDPAVSSIPFEVFDVLGRSMCGSLDAGLISAADDAIRMAKIPTGRGLPMRLQSTKAIVAAGIRAYCPHHAGQLGELDALQPAS